MRIWITAFNNIEFQFFPIILNLRFFQEVKCLWIGLYQGFILTYANIRLAEPYLILTIACWACAFLIIRARIAYLFAPFRDWRNSIPLLARICPQNVRFCKYLLGLIFLAVNFCQYQRSCSIGCFNLIPRPYICFWMLGFKKRISQLLCGRFQPSSFADPSYRTRPVFLEMRIMRLLLSIIPLYPSFHGA